MSEVLTFLWQLFVIYMFAGYIMRNAWKKKANDIRESVEDGTVPASERLHESARALRYWEAAEAWCVWPVALLRWNRDTKADWDSWGATQRLKMLERIRTEAQEKQAELDAKMRREEAVRNGGAETIDPGRFPDSP